MAKLASHLHTSTCRVFSMQREDCWSILATSSTLPQIDWEKPACAPARALLIAPAWLPSALPARDAGGRSAAAAVLLPGEGGGGGGGVLQRGELPGDPLRERLGRRTLSRLSAGWLWEAFWGGTLTGGSGGSKCSPAPDFADYQGQAHMDNVVCQKAWRRHPLLYC